MPYSWSPARETFEITMLPNALTKVTTHPAPAMNAEVVTNLPAALSRQGIKHLLLDWDGCMTRVSGAWHALIALEALKHSDTFQEHASATLQEGIQAYEGPGHGIDWFALFEQNLLRPKLAHCHDHCSVVERCMQDLSKNLASVAQSFASGELGDGLPIFPQPGVTRFLAEALNQGVGRSVISMTPTVVVRALAARAGLSELITDYFGCDYFTEFPEGKLDPALWRYAAQLSGCSISEAAIVEDSPRSLRGAVQSGSPLIVAMQDEIDDLTFLRVPGTEIWSTKTIGDLGTIERFDHWLYY